MSRAYWTLVRLTAAGVAAGLIGGLLVRRTPPTSASGYGCYGYDDGCPDWGTPQFTTGTVASLIAATLLAGLFFWLALRLVRPSTPEGPTGRPFAATLAVVILTAALYIGLLLATPNRYNRIPDGPAWWPSTLALPIAFVLVGLLRMRIAPRATATLLAAAVALAAIGIGRLHSTWHQDELRTEIAKLPSPAEVPALPGWHLVDTIIGFEPNDQLAGNRSNLALILTTDSRPPRWLVLTTNMDSAHPQGRPGDCTANCTADSPDRWLSHPDDRPDAFTLFVRRGPAVIAISGLNQGTDLDTVRSAASSLRPASAAELIATMRSRFP